MEPINTTQPGLCIAEETMEKKQIRTLRVMFAREFCKDAEQQQQEEEEEMDEREEVGQAASPQRQDPEQDDTNEARIQELWYTKKEISQLRKKMEHQVAKVRQAQRQGKCYSDSDCRGLEDFTSLRVSMDKKARKAAYLQAVLMEQARKKDNVESASSSKRWLLARETICQESQDVALQLAAQDEAQAQRIYREDKQEATSQQQQEDQEQDQQDSEADAGSSTEANSMNSSGEDDEQDHEQDWNPTNLVFPVSPVALRRSKVVSFQKTQLGAPDDLPSGLFLPQASSNTSNTLAKAKGPQQQQQPREERIESKSFLRPRPGSSSPDSWKISLEPPVRRQRSKSDSHRKLASASGPRKLNDFTVGLVSDNKVLSPGQRSWKPTTDDNANSSSKLRIPFHSLAPSPSRKLKIRSTSTPRATRPPTAAT